MPAEREEDATPYFEYELTNYPLSPFKDGMMRNGNKASFCNCLTKGIPKRNLPTKIVHVIEREALLWQVQWSLYTKFSDIYKFYERHLYGKFGYWHVVFDGYETVPPQMTCNIKKEVANFRSVLSSHSDTKCVKSPEEFLVNKNNKVLFIAALSKHLSSVIRQKNET